VGSVLLNHIPKTMKINSFLLKSGIVVAASGGVILSGLMAMAAPKCSFSGNGAPIGNNAGACTQSVQGKTVTWNINKACTCPGVDPNAKQKCVGEQNPSSGTAFSCQ
jgi:hypothetical protein